MLPQFGSITYWGLGFILGFSRDSGKENGKLLFKYLLKGLYKVWDLGLRVL